MQRLVLPPSLEQLLAAIRGAGGRPLIVGGAVRDAAAGLVAKDFDVEVYGLDVEQLVAALSTVGRVNAVGKSFGVLRVATGDAEVDVALPRRESKRGRGHRGFVVTPDANMPPEEAAARRDFTVNAMAYDPARGEWLDFFGGMEDLQRRVLRHVGPAFAEDPLRVLRGVQFAGRFDLVAADETVELSRSLFAEYDTLPLERIWAEWFKWAAKSTTPARGLDFLQRSGWIAAYPELAALCGCPQDPAWHPEGDVWTHTLLVADRAAEIAVRDALDGTDRAALLLAALCHDLGKPETTVQVEGRVRSPGHADRVDSYTGLLRRLGCPQRLAERVVVLCRFHLTHMNFAGSPRHVRRLARSLGQGGETIEMLARLVEADHGGRPPLPGGLPDNMRAVLALARELATAAAAPQRLLLGRHLLELGFAPGPQIGRILEAAYEAQLEGRITDLEQAKAWVRESF